MKTEPMSLSGLADHILAERLAQIESWRDAASGGDEQSLFALAGLARGLAQVCRMYASGIDGTARDDLLRLEGLGLMAPDCQAPACRERYAATNPVSVFAERHRASEGCESGKRNHCTCDVCF